MADNDPTQKDHPGVARVKQMWEHGDFDTIDRMVKLWTAFENIGALGDIVRRFIIWCGVIAGGYLVFAGYITDWIRSIR